ncbi:MAG: DUF29 family protein [Cyanobacteria bacterium RI_101]|nr:DUF29 family protein [Cyanobacteria bacterium RI_101]
MISSVSSKTLYEQDFNLWLTETVELLKTRQVERLNYENLIEELASIGISQKLSLEEYVMQILWYFLKWQYLSNKRSRAWLVFIQERRNNIKRILRDSLSLKRYLLEVLEDCYQDARFLASEETGLPPGAFPESLPFTVEQILERRFLPDLEDV